MGSRINIALSDLLGNQNIAVVLGTEEINDGEDNPGGHNTVFTVAEVTFVLAHDRSAESEFRFTFDCSVYEGKVELSADFNWFRYGLEEVTPQKKLMRALYEHSVSFTVHH